MQRALVWFRQDLRLADQPALQYVSQTAEQVFPVFILDPALKLGAAQQVWLDQSLKSLAADLKMLGSRLLLRRGHPEQVLPDLIKELNADGLCWNRRYDPIGCQIDQKIVSLLSETECELLSFNGSLLFEPWEIESKSKQTPYRVFTPYWKRCLEAERYFSVDARPKKLPPVASQYASDQLSDWDLLPAVSWHQGILEHWEIGEAAAQRCLQDFIDGPLAEYDTGRDRPDQDGTSRLSAHLHWGEISAKQIYLAVQGSPPSLARKIFLAEIGWREFAHHILYHFPETLAKPLNPRFEHFSWRTDVDQLNAWQQGLTGYPIVDAGMRQLWQTGWMHNRVRMIVASFLCKDLLIDWQAGADWFWDTLVDADLANNTLNWQWVAGCGADAAPFFRIFNPITQGQKFDPQGHYVRTWVPELAKLPNKWIHKPWQAPLDVLKAAELNLGSEYPEPIVDHAEARLRALAVFKHSR